MTASASVVGSVWTTADYALIVSLCSASMAAVSLAWNIWSKFIYPKPRLRVQFSFSYPVYVSGIGDGALELSAVNFGPGRVEVVRATVTIRGFGNKTRRGMISAYSDWPTSSHLSAVGAYPGLPSTISEGESCRVYLPLEFAKDRTLSNLGFVDSYSREHFLSRQDKRKLFGAGQ